MSVTKDIIHSYELLQVKLKNQQSEIEHLNKALDMASSVLSAMYNSIGIEEEEKEIKERFIRLAKDNAYEILKNL